LSSLDIILDEIDSLSRKLIRLTECSDRLLLTDLQLTPAQANTLLGLEHLGEVTMNGLADEMLLHGTTMTRMVDSLVMRGLVERLTDPKDRRVVRVRLTPSGGDAASEVRRRKREAMRKSLQRLPESDQNSLLKGLRRVVALAEERSDGRCGDPKMPPGS